MSQYDELTPLMSEALRTLSGIPDKRQTAADWGFRWATLDALAWRGLINRTPRLSMTQRDEHEPIYWWEG